MTSISILAKTGTALLAGLFALSLSAAVAQDAQPAKPTDTPVPATTDAVAAPALSTSHLAVARQVVELSGISRSLEVLIPEVLNKGHLMIARQRPEISAQLEAASKVVLVQLIPQREEILMIAATSFAREMSEADLNTIALFFKSSAGAAYVDKQPKMLQDLMLGMQPWTEQLNQTVVTLFRAELKKKGIEF